MIRWISSNNFLVKQMEKKKKKTSVKLGRKRGSKLKGAKASIRKTLYNPNQHMLYVKKISIKGRKKKNNCFLIRFNLII